jgi:hypothetical protein
MKEKYKFHVKFPNMSRKEWEALWWFCCKKSGSLMTIMHGDIVKYYAVNEKQVLKDMPKSGVDIFFYHAGIGVYIP